MRAKSVSCIIHCSIYTRTDCIIIRWYNVRTTKTRVSCKINEMYKQVLYASGQYRNVRLCYSYSYRIDCTLLIRYKIRYIQYLKLSISSFLLAYRDRRNHNNDLQHAEDCAWSRARFWSAAGVKHPVARRQEIDRPG